MNINKILILLITSSALNANVSYSPELAEPNENIPGTIEKNRIPENADEVHAMPVEMPGEGVVTEEPENTDEMHTMPIKMPGEGVVTEEPEITNPENAGEVHAMPVEMPGD